MVHVVGCTMVLCMQMCVCFNLQRCYYLALYSDHVFVAAAFES
jgi:hypothetical protein